MAEASRHPADADQIAQKLVPDSSDHDDSVWTESARSLVANVMRKLIAEGRATLADLLQALQSMPSDDLGEWLKNTSSARIFTPNSERATASVLFSLTKALELIKFLKHEQAPAQPFTFASYFANLDGHKGAKPWIFVPRRERYFETTKPLLACWLELASIGIMGLPPSEPRKVWMFLDELPDIPKVTNLQRLLPQGRKFGACVTITFQAIGQMRARYGEDAAEGLLANCNTKLFLQCADHDTREWASKTCGEVEAELSSDSSSLGFELGKGQTTVSRQRDVRQAILASEFKLPKFEGYLALPDSLPLTKVKLTNAHIIARGQPRQPGFVQGALEDTLYA